MFGPRLREHCVSRRFGTRSWTSRGRRSDCCGQPGDTVEVIATVRDTACQLGYSACLGCWKLWACSEAHHDACIWQDASKSNCFPGDPVVVLADDALLELSLSLWVSYPWQAPCLSRAAVRRARAGRHRHVAQKHPAGWVT